jgi:ABC-type glycerol-3-phosphate transport system substrate-binding protein
MNAKKTSLLLVLLTLALGLAACSQDGPAENAGEEIDNAAENFGDAMEDATDDAGNSLEEAGDAVEDATN